MSENVKNDYIQRIMILVQMEVQSREVEECQSPCLLEVNIDEQLCILPHHSTPKGRCIQLTRQYISKDCSKAMKSEVIRI